MTTAPRIAALFVSYNSGEYLRRALHSLWAQRIGGAPARFEVVVVDNASPRREQDRPILEQLHRDHGVKVVWNDVNSGYSGGMNLALAHTAAPLVLASNPDLVFEEGCIENLIAALEGDPRAGIVGPRGFLDEGKHLTLPVNQLPTLDDETERFRGRFRARAALGYSLRCAREAWDLAAAAAPVEIPMLSGACLLTRRDFLDRHGFFDGRFPLFYEDGDLCRRFSSLGLRNLYVPRASVVHFVSRSVATAPAVDDPMRRWATARERYFRKWYGAAGWDHVRRLDVALRRFGRLAGRPPRACQDLGTVGSPPELRFARAVPRALVQVGLDSGFYLCAFAAASGDSWRFPDTCWPFFATGANVFVRALDPRDWSVLATVTFRAAIP